MHKARWSLFAAVATPILFVAACVGDDSSEGVVDAAGSGGTSITGSGGGDAAGKADAAGTGGTGGSTGSGGSAGAAKDGGTGGSAGSGRDGGTGGSAGSAGTGGAGGAAGASIDAARDGTTTSDATAEGTGGARPDASNDASRPDGGTCMSGPVTGLTCTDYCSAWFGTCQPIAMWSSTYANPAACIAACSSWNDAKLCCRAEHVSNAVAAPNPNQAEKHCGHAVGVDGPAECND